MEGPPAAGGSGRCPVDGLDLLRENDEFMMAYCKVIPCNKGYPHDWSRCPFAHPTEASRRRDPRVHPHSGVACPRLKKERRCDMGDSCPFAHSIFEYWLHPTRYRTQLCKDGAACRRWLCFFAHSLEELRLPDSKPSAASAESVAAAAAAVAANAGAGVEQHLRGAPFPSEAGSGAMGGLLLPLGGQPLAAGPHAGTADRRQHAGSPGVSSGQAEVIHLVVQLLQSGELSADKAAAVLREMLPPEPSRAPHAPPAYCSAFGASSAPAQHYSAPGQPQMALAASMQQALNGNSGANGLGWSSAPSAPLQRAMLPAHLRAAPAMPSSSPMRLAHLSSLQGELEAAAQRMAAASAGARMAPAGAPGGPPFLHSHSYRPAPGALHSGGGSSATGHGSPGAAAAALTSAASSSPGLSGSPPLAPALADDSLTALQLLSLQELAPVRTRCC